MNSWYKCNPDHLKKDFCPDYREYCPAVHIVWQSIFSRLRGQSIRTCSFYELSEIIRHQLIRFNSYIELYQMSLLNIHQSELTFVTCFRWYPTCCVTIGAEHFPSFHSLVNLLSTVFQIFDFQTFQKLPKIQYFDWNRPIFWTR